MGGSSNSRGEHPRERPIAPKDLLATIYTRMGIDHDVAFPDRVNRPIAVVPAGGEPIRELL